MNNNHQSEQKDELRDLDVPDEQAEAVSGGKPRVIEGNSPYIVVTMKQVLVSS